jgi:protocatechuate 3,4-dioxygenase beta subunit
MTSSIPSLRRRQLVIAGLAGAAAPNALFAAQCTVSAFDPSAPPTVAEVSVNASGEKLIVSGRVVGADCRPLFGAVVEAWHEGSRERAGATTDADGRFMLTTVTAAQGRPLNVRVSHGERRLVQQRRFTDRPGVVDDRLAGLQRDDAGVWRTTLGLTLA